MSENSQLIVSKRENSGTGDSRSIRLKKKIPAKYIKNMKNYLKTSEIWHQGIPRKPTVLHADTGRMCRLPANWHRVNVLMPSSLNWMQLPVPALSPAHRHCCFSCYTFFVTFELSSCCKHKTGVSSLGIGHCASSAPSQTQNTSVTSEPEDLSLS